jgi:hypothetical protein
MVFFLYIIPLLFKFTRDRRSEITRPRRGFTPKDGTEMVILFFLPSGRIIPLHLTLQGSSPDMSVEERREGARCRGTPEPFLNEM